MFYISLVKQKHKPAEAFETDFAIQLHVHGEKSICSLIDSSGRNFQRRKFALFGQVCDPFLIHAQGVRRRWRQADELRLFQIEFRFGHQQHVIGCLRQFFCGNTTSIFGFTNWLHDLLIGTDESKSHDHGEGSSQYFGSFVLIHSLRLILLSYGESSPLNLDH